MEFEESWERECPYCKKNVMVRIKNLKKHITLEEAEKYDPKK